MRRERSASKTISTLPQKRSPCQLKSDLHAAVQESQHLVLKKGWDCSAASKQKERKRRSDLEDVRLLDSFRIIKKFGSRTGERNSLRFNRSSTGSTFSINSTSQLVILHRTSCTPLSLYLHVLSFW